MTFEKEYFVETFGTFSPIKSFSLWTYLGILTLNVLAMASSYLRMSLNYILFWSLADAFISSDGDTTLQLAGEALSLAMSLGLENTCISGLSFGILAGSTFSCFTVFGTVWLSFNFFSLSSRFSTFLYLALFWFFFILIQSSDFFCLSFYWRSSLWFSLVVWSEESLVRSWLLSLMLLVSSSGSFFTWAAFFCPSTV